MSAVRVLILSADPLARAGLAALLAGDSRVEVVGQVDGAGGSVAGLLEVYRPDVIAWDAGWQAATLLEQLADLAEDGVPVALLLSDETDAAAAWPSGVRGLLRRTIQSDRLAAALVALAANLTVIDSDFHAALRGTSPPAMTHLTDPSSAATAEALTPRELEVLRLMADGLPNKTIAARLHISEHTVKFHVNAIFGKLGAASRTEAVVTANRSGLILL